MSKKDQVYQLLLDKDLTSKEISQELQRTNETFTENETKVYIYRLKNEGLVKSVGKKTFENDQKERAKPYTMYRGIPMVQGKKDASLDTTILKKMIPKFVETGIKIELTTNEINRIKQLASEVL
ncbi:MAG: hypothetical protein GF311_26575 [Candidatus Lokiarchaeota archaeon]|nr:hypothetical protein [Candidatus Lokiarchaeota archaeon]